MTDKDIVLRDEQFISDVYNQFSPDYPLPDEDSRYVSCREVRGDDNIIRAVGRKITLSDVPTYQLYTGHRGGGKSTEIAHLKAYLEEKGCRVIYFEADEYIDTNDVNYTDILLACTRRIVEELTEVTTEDDQNLVYRWFVKRFNELLNLGFSEQEIENWSLELGLSPLVKIIASLKTVPSQRQAIREKIKDNQDSFNAILNEFIEKAKENLKGKQRSKLVVIADNLDRIILQRRKDGSNNYEEIFIDQSYNLQSINCHVVYTAPISLIYSKPGLATKEIYGTTEVLPMIMVRNKDGTPCQKGIDKIKEIIEKRVDYATKPFLAQQNLTPQGNQPLEITVDDLFDSHETLTKLCQMTGGHVREIMLLMQEAISRIDYFPITLKAMNAAIATSRNVLRAQVDHQDWEKLVYVSQHKAIINETEYRELLFSRCVLEYREEVVDDLGEDDVIVWHDVHPLIENIKEFKNAVNR